MKIYAFEKPPHECLAFCNLEEMGNRVESGRCPGNEIISKTFVRFLSQRKAARQGRLFNLLTSGTLLAGRQSHTLSLTKCGFVISTVSAVGIIVIPLTGFSDIDHAIVGV